MQYFQNFHKEKTGKNQVPIFRLFLLHWSWEDPSFPHMQTPGHCCACVASPHSLYRPRSDPANICFVLHCCLPIGFFTPKQKKEAGRKEKKNPNPVVEYLEKHPPYLNTGKNVQMQSINFG